MKGKWGLFTLLVAAVTAMGIYQQYRPSKTTWMASNMGFSLIQALSRQICLQTAKKCLLALAVTVAGKKLCQKTLAKGQ